jgi:2-amino-4-hydroxy-6-hydroxymethyldihydropteridine diphosphokinase
VRVVVGLGANLGDRLATIRAAVAAMGAVAAVERLSRVYETEPIGPPQPSYLNAAVLLDWHADALGLLDALQVVEKSLGRIRTERWGPRTIDLDVLWIEGLSFEHPRLVVPHPRLHERAFALLPLLDVAPGARHPTTGEAYASPASQGVRVVRETVG